MGMGQGEAGAGVWLERTLERTGRGCAEPGWPACPRSLHLPSGSLTAPSPPLYCPHCTALYRRDALQAHAATQDPSELERVMDIFREFVSTALYCFCAALVLLE
jgi:hypothetical protein